MNPAAIRILRNNKEKIYWFRLSSNPNAMSLIKKQGCMSWKWLSMNPSAIQMLEANPEQIDWSCLSENPAAIHLLEANLDKIHWRWLAENPEAIHILEANPQKIDWAHLSANPAIFEYDYKAMVRPFTEELMANRFHPDNLDKFESWGYE